MFMSFKKTLALPEPRPVLWPLRPFSTAKVEVEHLPDGRRRITVKHQKLQGITPEMLSWWYGHVNGTMEYAGKTYSRYLVWHPLDHISYEVFHAAPDGSVVVGSKLCITEAFQRNPANLLRISVRVMQRDEQGAVVAKRAAGMTLVELVNRFEATKNGTHYTSIMTIGTKSWPGRLGLNKILTAKVLPGDMALNWARHHVEEIGNLEHFLPALYTKETMGNS